VLGVVVLTALGVLHRKRRISTWGSAGLGAASISSITRTRTRSRASKRRARGSWQSRSGAELA